ncbi:MAG: 30S ribosomal protein S16 [Thermodesulfobacteriota bacterium]
MAVRIRLSRKGRKKNPFYRIVAADAEAKRDGRCLEILGYYDPMRDPAAIKVHHDKLQYWLSQGAKPSTTVKSLIAKSRDDIE